MVSEEEVIHQIMAPIVSLCMPTNGVPEWVFPVLESISSQGVSDSLYEVVITDNGENEDFKREMREKLAVHPNWVYAETEALPFHNEIESYKRASGEFIKFVNHRTLMAEGMLTELIRFVEENRAEKPVIFFSNAKSLILEERAYSFDSFDAFVKHLSHLYSYSTGMAIWREDFLKLPEDVSSFNELFPHTNVLFAERNRGKYIIDNRRVLEEVPQGNRPKGSYDLFYTFGVEGPGIILDLLREKAISADTFRSVVNDNLTWIAEMYITYCIRKQYCSYDLSGLKDMYGIFYREKDLKLRVAQVMGRKIGEKTGLKKQTGR